jgi:hypothetical protein
MRLHPHPATASQPSPNREPLRRTINVRLRERAEKQVEEAARPSFSPLPLRERADAEGGRVRGMPHTETRPIDEGRP